MIKILLLFLVMALLAWFSLDYLSISLAQKDLSKFIEKKESPKEPFKALTNHVKIATKESENNNTLSDLLKKDLFYDALTFYHESENEKNRKQIESYLSSLLKINSNLALEYMQVFVDDVPESMLWKLMISTHIELSNLNKAIELIMHAQENYISEAEDRRLSLQLREVSIQYIDMLMKSKEYATLRSFLEKMIAHGDRNHFYTFRLAQLLMELEETEEAVHLLESLEYDEVYAQKAKNILDSMDEEEDGGYKYALPLQHYAGHYVLEVYLDGIAFKLMLDTGATIIFIDEQSASALQLDTHNIVLRTAGNDVHAKIGKVSQLSVGDIELSNIKVTIAPFPREGIDGLLGMNFFKRFTFFIDQEEHILYLDPKD